MSTWSLLRVMIWKEARTTFRERAQLRGVIISVTCLIIAIAAGLTGFFHDSHYSGWGRTDEQARMVQWAAIVVASAVSFFFSIGYLLASVLAAFVGEKEAKTLEVLLACPLSDRKLYLAKCVSVLLPAATIGYFFAAAVMLLALKIVPADAVYLPPSLLFYALVLGVPVMLSAQIFFVGVGAAISAKAETLKGAAQAFSGVLMLFIFGGIYGVPLALYHFPALRPPVMAWGQRWLGFPFVAQYGLVVLGLAIPAAIALGVGRLLFRRDRMLT